MPKKPATEDQQTTRNNFKPRDLQKFVVQWDFKADKRDEVDLVSGDVVLVVKIYQDGWCRGIRCRDYKVGCFPLNYLVKEENISGKRQSILLLERAHPVEQRPTNKEVKTGLLIDFDDDKNFKHKSYHDDWSFGRGSNGSSYLGDDMDDIDYSNESEDEPPDLPEKYSKILEREKELKARTRAAEEILSSEVSYSNGLRLLTENYINPMRDQKVVSKSDVCRIFSNVESLASISDELIKKLQDRLSNWDVQSTLLGDVLQEMFSYLKMFEPYFNSRQKANEVLAKLEKNSEKYKSFISKVNCVQTLDSLLLMPVQRIPRYELLLKELVKRTKEDHPDYWSLKEALNKAKKAAADLNEHIRKIENETKVVQVMKKFPNDELNLIRPVSQTTLGRGMMDSQRTRKYEKEQIATLSKSLKRISLPLSQPLEDTPRLSRSASTSPMTAHRERSPARRLSSNVLVRQGTSVDDGDSDSSDESQSLGETFIYTSVYIGEGPVERVTRKASGTSEGGMVHETVERYLFLFNDVLLLASSSGKKNYKLKANLPLAKSWVTSTNVYYTNPPETMFLLGTPTQIYKFLAPSTKERKTWERDLDKCIEKEKMLFFQSFERLPIPDEVYLAATMETKIDYQRATDGVELNLRQGEEVLVIGFIDGDQWHPGLYPHSVFEQGKEWWPGIQKGKFGWFPAQCVTGSETTSLHATEEELHPIPAAVALSRIKRTMLQWTKNEELPIMDVKVVKVYRPDTSFKTCKVEPYYLISDLLRQYTKHKSFRGADIDINILELAEESLDGSVLKHDQPLSNILAMWGKYQEKMRLVIREIGEAQSGLVSQLLGSA